MKKILISLAIALFTITVSAQEAKPVEKEKATKESCCANKATTIKVASAHEIADCKAKCKAEGKKCTAGVTVAEGKKCSTEMAKAEGKKCCAKKA